MLGNILTKKTIEIISLLLDSPEHIRGIAEKLSLSPGHVHSRIKYLKKYKLIIEKKIKNKNLISLNNNNPLLIRLKSTINYFNLANTLNFKKLQKKGSVGIYGSYAKGTDDKYSDIDLWIYSSMPQTHFADLIRHLEKEIKRKVNLLILNKQKIKNIKKNDYEFFLRLKLTSITQFGDIFD